MHRLILVAAILVAYSNSFHCEFQFDDLSNIKIATAAPVFNFGFYLWNFRAIGQASLALDHWLYADNVVGYHVTNLLVHVGTTLLLYALAMLTFQTPFMLRATTPGKSGDDWRPLAYSIAFFTALLFAVHPIQTQAVTYIVQRFTSLASLFYLASVYCYVRARLAYASGASPHCPPRFQVLIFYILAFLSAILAMRTKEIAFTLPLAIVVFEFLLFDGRPKTRLLFLAPFLLLLTLPLIPLGILSLQPGTTGIFDVLDASTRVKTQIPRAHYLFTEFRVVITYLRLLFFPAGQILDYDYPTYDSLFHAPVFLSFLCLLVLFGLALTLLFLSHNTRSLPGGANRLGALGIIWFFLTLSIESSVLPIRDVINEHRLYLPSAGIFFAVCTAVIIGARQFRDRYPKILTGCFVAFGVIAILFTFLTFRRNQVWATPVSLWEDVTRKSPNRSRPWNNLGYAYLQRHEPLKAIPVLIRSYELNPGWADVPSNIALALKQIGSFEGRYLTGFEFLSKDGQIRLPYLSAWLPIALNNLGLAYEVLGQRSKAVEKFDRAIRMAPKFAAARLNRGLAALAAGDLDRARAERAILEDIAPPLASVLRERLQETGHIVQELPYPSTQGR